MARTTSRGDRSASLRSLFDVPHLILGAGRTRFGKAVARTAGTNMVQTVLAGIAGIIVARQLGPSGRGELAVVVQWTSALGFVAAFGLNHSACYWVAKQRYRAAQIVSTACASAVVAGGLLGALGLIVAPMIGRTAEVERYLALALLASPAYILGGVLNSSLQAIDAKTWNLSRLIQPVMYLVPMVAIALIGELTLGRAVGLFVGSVVTQVASVFLLRSRGVKVPSKPSRALLAPLYRYGSQVFLAAAPHVVNARVDVLVLSVMATVSAASLGLYVVAVSLTQLSLPFAVAFGSIAFPRVASSGSLSERRRIERSALLGGALTSAVILSGLVAVAPWAIPLLFGKAFAGALVPLWILAPGTVFLVVNRIAGDILNGQGRPLTAAIGEGVAVAMTVGLLIALVPRYGVNGAAAASSAAYLTATAFLVQAIRRSHDGSIDRDQSWPKASGAGDAYG